MPLTAHITASAIPDTGVFDTVLCGISGSRSDAEVVRQAAALAGRSGNLSLRAVTWESGTGPNAVALLSRRRADDALERAAAVARGLGVKTDARTVADMDAGRWLVEAADDHDLVVLGASGAGRMQGLAVTRVASVVLHTARRPVLIARPPDGLGFPGPVLLASDGSPDSRRAAEITARIAHLHGARVALAAPRTHDAVSRRELGQQAALLRIATGVDPVLLEDQGSPARGILTVARSWDTALVVIGSRRLRGLAAIGSVSERIAHEARCSVLVAR